MLKEIVAVQDLCGGMFVSELDRPWLESPFMLQGFLIEDEATLAQIRQLCRFVYVDRARSIGSAWRAAPVAPEAAGADRTPSDLGTFVVKPELRRQPLDFFALLKSLRGLKGNAGTPTVGESGATEPWLRIYPDMPAARKPGVAEPGPERRGTASSTAQPLVTTYNNPASASSSAQRTGDEAVKGSSGLPSGMRFVEQTTSLDAEIVAALPLVTRAQTLLAEIARDVQSNLNPDLERLRGVVSEMVLSVIRNPDALLWLLRLKRTDQYSYDHSLDVAAHVMIFGRALGLGEDSITTLGMAGLLQDIGKLRLPPRLLHKIGALSPREYEIFKTHVDFSLQILSVCPHATPPMLEIIARHHERCDGSGYPAGLKGDDVGLMAEIAGVCDVYCAMTRERPYGAAVSSQNALDSVRGLRGKRFSVSIVDQFVQCIGLYPVGTLVELNSGEVAVVVSQNRIRRLKPRVMILLGPDKKPNAYPQTLDLLYDPSCATGEPYEIVRALPPGAFGVEPSAYYLA
ncbi:MAG: HD-GYP domain-containing protein [Zoogloea sp.]|nr:HD-GYP domain-containing protein [Zoogloea sp.]